MKISQAHTGVRLKSNKLFGELVEGDNIYIIKTKGDDAFIATFKVTDIEPNNRKDLTFTYTDFEGKVLIPDKKIYADLDDRKDKLKHFPDTTMCFGSTNERCVIRKEYPMVWLTDKSLIKPLLEKLDKTAYNKEYLF